MTTQQPDETVNRFTIAAHDLLRRDLDPAFAGDGVSVAFVAGPPLDARTLAEWAIQAEETQIDLIYLAFEPGREHHGPTSVSVFGERSGAVLRWTDCVLWAPKDGGPLLIMPKGLNVCFGHDGKALISLPERPSQSLRNGVERARQRLKRASREVARDRLDKVEREFREAA